MVTKVIKCSNCGSPLNINKNRKQCKCSYCGSINILENMTQEEIMDVNEVLKKGAKYEGNNNDSKAIKLYDSFLEINPNEPLVLFARALISLIDSPNDDFNITLFEEYFNKGLNASKDNMMPSLDFLMYQFRRYTIPSMCTWQHYAYNKLESINKREARKRMSKNMLLLFKIQNIIINLVENSHFEKLSKTYIEEYKNFQNSIVKFGEDLLEDIELYGLKFGFANKLDIKDSIRMAKRRYKQFTRKYDK